MNRRIQAALAAGALIGASVAAPASAAFTVPPDHVGEIVGMAWDDETARLWLAGEEADDGTLIGLTEDGEQAQLTWNADIVSVEALSLSGGALFVGDLGNPDLDRDTLTIFRFGDTQPGQKQYRAYVLEYPDGPRDAQAMMVSGRGRIYIATTGDDPGIYRAPENPSRTSTDTLTRVADAPEGVTDGVFLADGSTLVLRAADGVHVIDAFSWETQAVETYVNGPEGESVAAMGDTLLFSAGGVVREAEVPTSDTTTTLEPIASPEPSPEPSEPAPTGTEGMPSPSPTAQPAAPSGNTPRNTGTLVALAIAGVVAIAAGATTYFVKG